MSRGLNAGARLGIIGVVVSMPGYYRHPQQLRNSCTPLAGVPDPVQVEALVGVSELLVRDGVWGSERRSKES